MFSFPLLLFSQGAIMGEVYDVGGESLPGATIVLSNTEMVTSTDAYGFFMFRDIPLGEYTIEITYVGKNSTKKRSL